jgi:hypothetical protein
LGVYAWVIDGATDVAEERLLPGGSDAAWLATVLDDCLRRLAPGGPGLDEALAAITAEAARRFAAERLRAPRERHELPSASGILARLDGDALEFLSLGDCSLLIEAPDGAVRFAAGGGLSDGDRRTSDAIRIFQRSLGAPTAAQTLAAIMPRLRAGRSDMNLPGGYGVFSVEPVPAEYVRIDRMALPGGAHLLLASDGFMRLADVYGRYRLGELPGVVRRKGLAALMAELRGIESADPDCHAVARAKPSDDASAMLIAVG